MERTCAFLLLAVGVADDPDRLDSPDLETFHLDIAFGDPIPEAANNVTAPPLLSFAGIRPSKVPCYPLSVQIAEKVHAYTRPYTQVPSSRVRDLVDILLIASLGKLDNRKLSRALRATFEARRTHALPARLPKAPANWSGPYRKLARELRLDWRTIADAEDAAARSLNRVLRGNAAQKLSLEPAGFALLPGFALTLS